MDFWDREVLKIIGSAPSQYRKLRRLFSSFRMLFLVFSGISSKPNTLRGDRTGDCHTRPRLSFTDHEIRKDVSQFKRSDMAIT